MSKPKPITEIQLFDLQEKFLATRNVEYRQEMFKILVSYATSLTLKKNRGKVYLQPTEVLSIAGMSATAFMEDYDKKKNFKIENSFAGILRFKILENLYGVHKAKEENHLSLNSMVNDGNTEFSELQKTFNIESLWSPIIDEISIVENNVLEDIHCIFEEYDDAVKDFKLSYYSRLLFLMIFKTKKKKLEEKKDKFRALFNLSEKDFNTFELLLLEIRNRLKA